MNTANPNAARRADAEQDAPEAPSQGELVTPTDAPPKAGTELSLPERALAAIKLDVTVAQLTELASKTTSITAITNADGRTQAHSAAMVLREHRLVIEKAGKAAREDANKFAKEVIVQSAKLVQLIAPEEERLIGLRDEWDKAREAEKQAKAEAERKRVQAIHARIQDMRDLVAGVVGKSASEIETAIKDFTGIVITAENFGELVESATQVHANVLARLRSMHAERLRADQERAEREERERQREQELQAEMQRQREERALNQKRLKRIAEIQQQTIVATTGKAGRKPGTRECIAETLTETEAMSVTEEEFGDLLPNAVASRDAAVAQIRGHLERWDEREADRQRQEQERARQRAEQRRLDDERAAAQAEQQRIAAENARQADELRRQQEAIEQQRREQDAAAQAERDRLAEEQRKIEADRQQVEVLQASLAAQTQPVAAPEPAPESTADAEPRTTIELPIAPIGGEVPCKLCTTPTRALRTLLCDGCYDLGKHITVATAVSAITLSFEALGISDRMSAVTLLKMARKAQAELRSQAGAA